MPSTGALVASLSSAMQYGPERLDEVPPLVITLCEGEEPAWRHFTTKRGQDVRYERFEDFCTTEPLAGLGCKLDTLQRACRDDVRATALITEALRRPPSLHHAVDNINSSSRPDGTSAPAAHRRLSKDRPDLHERVLAGELSPHGAMVEAGFRPPRISVRLDDPQRAANAIKRGATPEFIEQLKGLL